VDEVFKLDGLARAAGTSPRTVRYYVQRGLLPGPTFKGKDSSYGREHLVRLRAIKKLQDAFLPLDAIAAELEGKSLEELLRVADEAGGARARPVTRPEPAPAARRESRWRRVEIAPGVELALAEDAPRESRVMAERLLEMVEAMSNMKEGR
jgi:DNA-binding transcriptional MerR regulator